MRRSPPGKLSSKPDSGPRAAPPISTPSPGTGFPAFAARLGLLVVLALPAFLAMGPAARQAPAQGSFEPEARAIMERVYDRPDGIDRRSKVTLILTNRRGSKRVRSVESFSKDYGADRKSAMAFLEPADVKGTIYLSWEYRDAGREDDKWLYLPAMRKDRRVSGDSRNESFMGTDFTYDDMGRRPPEKDSQRLLGEEDLPGGKAWIVECLPLDPEEGYRRRVAWVDQKNLMIVKAEYYDRNGLLKLFEVRRVAEIGPYTAAADCLMRNVVTGHQTELLMEDIEYDTGLADDLFSVATIRRGRL